MIFAIPIFSRLSIFTFTAVIILARDNTITNIFVFVFGSEVDPEYIRIRIRVTKNIPNIFVFVFGSQKNYLLRSGCDMIRVMPLPPGSFLQDSQLGLVWQYLECNKMPNCVD